MKEIASQYGAAVIAAIVGGLLFFLLFHIPIEGKEGLAQMVGVVTKQQTEQTIQDKYSRNEEQYARQIDTHLQYLNDNPIVAGEKTKVWDHFSVDDDNGQVVKAKICVIMDQQKNRYSMVTENGEDYIYLERAGIYQVYFQITDSFYRTQYAILWVPVQVNKL